MYSPAIINPEQAFQPLLSSKDCFGILPSLNSFSGGASFFGRMDLNTYEQDSSLLLYSNLSPQTDYQPLVFWNKPNSQEGS